MKIFFLGKLNAYMGGDAQNMNYSLEVRELDFLVSHIILLPYQKVSLQRAKLLSSRIRGDNRLFFYWRVTGPFTVA